MTKTSAALGALLIFTSAVLSGCGGSDDYAPSAPGEVAIADRVKPEGYIMPPSMDSLRPQLERHLRQVFNDSNHIQLPHAIYMGIDPIESPAEAYRTTRPIVKIKDSATYRLDSLTHSVPFLVPEAARLLEDIGLAFRDTLQRRGLPPLRLKVTSLLRTKASVKKLRRVNRNATSQSTHQYGTTFDISYRSFYTNSGDEVYDPRYRLALAEAIYDLRSAHRCMVKYELKSPCFHITVIK